MLRFATPQDFATLQEVEVVLTDKQKLDLIRKWLHPGLWSAMDTRRRVLLSIVDGGESVDPWHLIDQTVEDWHGQCRSSP